MGVALPPSPGCCQERISVGNNADQPPSNLQMGVMLMMLVMMIVALRKESLLQGRLDGHKGRDDLSGRREDVRILGT